MSLPMARLASSPASPNNSSLRTPMIQSGVENNVVISTPSQATGQSQDTSTSSHLQDTPVIKREVENNVAVSTSNPAADQNQQTSTSSQLQASLQPSNSVASPHPASASLDVQGHVAIQVEQDIPAPASAALQQDNVLSGMDQPMVDQPLLAIPNAIGHIVFQPLPVIPIDMGPMVFEAGCPCLDCQQWIAQQRQGINDLTRHIEGLEALIRPADPPAIQPTPKALITKLPTEILNMIVSYVMGDIHDWHYSPPKAPLYTQVEDQQQGQSHGHAYAHAQPEGKRGAGFLTDEKLQGLSQTCKRFRDICNDFGAHDYLLIWTEFDEFLRDDFTRLSEANRGSGVISRVKHLVIRPPPNGRAYVSRPNKWKYWGEARRLDCVRTVMEGMNNLVSLEIYSSKKYDTLRNALKNRTIPTVRSLTLDSLAPLMGTLIRSFPNLRVLRSRSTGVWDRPDNEVFKSLQSAELIETACFLGTRDNRIYRQHRTPRYAVERLPQLNHLFWEFNEPHTRAEDANMIEALRAHNKIRKFTMLRHAARPPPDYSLVYDDDTTVANLYFNGIPHLEEIGICRAKDIYGYGHADSGKVFVRIKRQVKAVKPVANEDGNGSNKEEGEKKTKTDKTDKTAVNPAPETITLERKKVLRIYDYTQSDEYRIKQLELGHIPRTPDRNPNPGVACDPEYSMFELEWKWARYQTLKEMYEREASEAAAKAASQAEAVSAAVAEAKAAAGIPQVPVVEDAPAATAGIPAVATAAAGSSSSSSVSGGIPAAAAPRSAAARPLGPPPRGFAAAAARHGVIVPASVFGGGAAAAANVLPDEDTSQSIDDASSSNSSTST